MDGLTQASANRHVLAVLRRVLGNIEQHRLARRVGCSVETIRKIEKGRLNLSHSLAIKIQDATGVSLRWLLNNDLKTPPYTVSGETYSLEKYDNWQANRSLGCSHFSEVHVPLFLFAFYEAMRHVMAKALKENKLHLAVYRLTQITTKFQEEFTENKPEIIPWFIQEVLRLVEEDLNTTKRLIDLSGHRDGYLGQALDDELLNVDLVDVLSLVARFRSSLERTVGCD